MTKPEPARVHFTPAPPCDLCKTTSGVVRVEKVFGEGRHAVRRVLCAACAKPPTGGDE